MDLINRVIHKFSKSSFALLIFGFTIILLVLVYVFSEKLNVPIKYFLADPLSIFDVNPLIGIISNLGILLWCATASVLIFTFLLVIGKVENKKASFLFYAALLTGFLLFDDLFMFHDRILTSLGIDEKLMYGIYVILFGFLIFGFYKILLSAQYKYALVIAFLSFGSSVFIDLLFTGEKFRMLFEDGFKFLGIVCWTLFFGYYCLELIRNTFQKERRAVNS